MTKGWFQGRDDYKRHYFIDGVSLCKKRQTLAPAGLVCYEKNVQDADKHNCAECKERKNA